MCISTYELPEVQTSWAHLLHFTLHPHLLQKHISSMQLQINEFKLFVSSPCCQTELMTVWSSVCVRCFVQWLELSVVSSRANSAAVNCTVSLQYQFMVSEVITVYLGWLAPNWRVHVGWTSRLAQKITSPLLCATLSVWTFIPNKVGLHKM